MTIDHFNILVLFFSDTAMAMFIVIASAVFILLTGLLLALIKTLWMACKVSAEPHPADAYKGEPRERRRETV